VTWEELLADVTARHPLHESKMCLVEQAV